MTYQGDDDMSMFGRNGKTPVEKDQRDAKFDARPPQVRAAEVDFEPSSRWANVDGMPSPATSLLDAIEDIGRKLDILVAERETTNTGIAAIKQIVAGLTYGEMVELRDQLEKHIPNIGNSEATSAIVKSLPETMHKWATS